ncbi:TPA: hypothetical protein EYP27_00085 [Candidatus Bathyarchaeota archaeon]|nr:hypothetical protein [Candidatus Bathyarchaeota archaeon]
MEAEKVGVEELKRLVLIREKDAADAFEKMREIIVEMERETSETKKWELLGRLRVAESILLSSVGKLLASYRAYTTALEKRLSVERR